MLLQKSRESIPTWPAPKRDNDYKERIDLDLFNVQDIDLYRFPQTRVDHGHFLDVAWKWVGTYMPSQFSSVLAVGVSSSEELCLVISAFFFGDGFGEGSTGKETLPCFGFQLAACCA